MAKRKVKKARIHPQRLHFQKMLAKNPNYFGNLPKSKLKPNFKLIGNVFYERLTCVGYNPETTEMEATFEIRRPYGYGGKLCSKGTFEYIRYYMDFQDGNGYIDQGMVRVNVHDIPSDKDCAKKSIFPIKYVATLKKKTRKFNICTKPVLPKLRAILSWGVQPPPNAPFWIPPWGNRMDCDVQLKPYWLRIPNPDLQIDLAKFLDLAIDSPEMTTLQLSELAGIDLGKLRPQPIPPGFETFIKQSKKLRVPAQRYAYKSVKKMIKYPDSEITQLQKGMFKNAKVDVGKLINKYLDFELKIIDKSKANVDYEELKCIGLDYHAENLVATVEIKKQSGYSGDLCSQGSKEYIAFWIDWDDKCKWEYLDTVEINVHNIKMKGNKLCYSVSLPLDTTYHKKICQKPNVVRVRGVLSWNIPPSTTNPDQLNYYGNRIDRHVQIQPGFEIPDGHILPLYNIIGGIPVDQVNDGTGLTKPGSFFAYNGNSVPTGAPFGGKVVLNGPAFVGHRYRIKLTNLANGNVSYYNDSFTVVGHLPYPPYVQYTTQTVDGAGYYPFLPVAKNTLNVLARLKPGTNDKFRIELEVFGIPGSFGKTIQMDHIKPDIELTIDDGGDCTHYKVGDTITGHFYVHDKHIRRWRLYNTWTGTTIGTGNTLPKPGNAISINTPSNAHPCGRVSLWAEDKTIVNSQSIGYEDHRAYNICLQDK